MVGTFAFQDKKIELGFEKAEQIKKSVGIPEVDKENEGEELSFAQIRAMLRPQLERLSTEIKHSFDYFESRFKKTTSKKLFLIGGGAKLKNLVRILSNSSSIDIDKLPVPKILNLDNKISLDYIQLAPAIGACLDSNELNILPKKLKIEKIKRISFSCIRVGLVVAFVVFVWAFIVLNFNAKRYLHKLKYANFPVKNIEKVESMYKYIKNVQNVNYEITRDDVPAYFLLKGLSNVIPGSVAIEKFELDNAKRILNLTGEIVVSEFDLENRLIKFKSRLSELPFFSKVSLREINKVDVGGNKANFRIICHLGNYAQEKN